MKIALLAAAILLPSLLRANTVKVISPDTAQTYTYSSITWHSLRWNAARQQFTARITFSNYNYVSHDEALDEESYDFAFPGVKFDPSDGTFFVKARNGNSVPVARLSKDLIGQSIKPLPGTVIHVIKRSGKVIVVLTASDMPGGNGDHPHWNEYSEGFFLDNLMPAGI